jgi:hypothetical protein
MIPLSDKAEPTALCFRSAQDAIDYAHHLTQESNRRFAAIDLDAVNRYVKGDVSLVVRMRTEFGSRECDLVFVRVPIGISAAQATANDTGAAIVGKLEKVAIPNDRRWLLRNLRDGELCPSDIEGSEGAVLLGVTELVQSPEGIISSFVWLEAPKQRCDFRRQICANLPFAVDIVVESGRVVSERKVGFLEPLLPGGNRAGVSGLVQYGSEVVRGVKNDTGQCGWQPPCEFDLVKVLSGLEILVNSVGPWLCAYELVDFGIEIVDVMLCARDGEARTSEGIVHGRQTIPCKERARSESAIGGLP